MLNKSKFWKQFFESSANVSLSGYEEQPSQAEGFEETVTEDSNATTHTTLETSQSYETPSTQHISTDSIQDIDLSNLTISPSHSTPRPTASQRQAANFADYPSPYEALRQEVNNTTVDATILTQATAPETPGRPNLQPTNGIAITPQSSPFLPPQPASMVRPSTTRKKTDPILHRVLDKTYRVQATPMTAARFETSKSKPIATPGTASNTRSALFEDTLSSSPEFAPPQLHAEVFSSPQRKPRTPGVSVLTPAGKKAQGKQQASTRTPGIWDSDEDDFDEDIPFGHSPPKTMQFHVPQSRLMKTPGECFF